MARAQARASEDKLRALIKGWKGNDVPALAKKLDVDEKTVNSWVARLRRTMKESGMDQEQIKELLPPKRRVQENPFLNVVREIMAEEPPKSRGRKLKAE